MVKPRSEVAEILNRVIFVALLVLVALVAVPYGTVDPWWIAIFECTVFGLGALSIIERQVAGVWRIGQRSLIAPLVTLLVFAVFQTVPLWRTHAETFPNRRFALSVDPYQTRLWILRAAALLVAGILLWWYTTDERRLRILVHVLIGIGLASAAFGIFRQVVQFQLPIMRTLSDYGDGAYGQFLNRNHFALLMEMTLGLTLGLIVSKGMGLIVLPLYLAAAGLLWGALVLSNSRGGILSMIGQLFFLALAWSVTQRRSQRRTARLGRIAQFASTVVGRTLLPVFLIAGIAIGVLWLGGDALMRRLEVTPRELNSETASRDNTSRLSIWKSTVGLIGDHPIAGVGFGAYWKAIPGYHDASGRWIPQQAHNDYLELAANGGIVGVGLGAWFIVVIYRRVRQLVHLAKGTFADAARLGALVGLVGVALHSLVDFGLHVTANAFLCVALIVIAAKYIPKVTSSRSPAW